jgi:hypothetical protein
MDGPVGAVVVTAVADTVALAVSPGVITVGVTTGTDDTDIWVTTSVYTFSMIDRLAFSVLVSERYPHLPSAFG